MKSSPWLKKIIIAFWIIFLAFCLGIILLNPQLFTPQNIADFLVKFEGRILAVYLIICMFRGFTLVPSSPFVLAGTILYPHEPFWVLLISMIGIIFSSTLIYYFSDYLGFRDYLERKHQSKIVKIKPHLEKSTGAFFVFFWSFFPLVPTDAVCYVAGMVRMKYSKFITALALGELLLCAIYIFFASYLIKTLYS